MENQGAMNLSFGDLLVLQHTVMQYTRNVDLSLLAGQHLQEILGKLEYQMRSIQDADRPRVGPAVKPVEFPQPGK
jgi:hypothetical protein